MGLPRVQRRRTDDRDRRPGIAPAGWHDVFVDRLDVRLRSVIACALLLLSAKVSAPHPLPALGAIAVMAAGANWFAGSTRPAAESKQIG